ncbi:carbohydrate sulfotransferase 4-like [Mizuhopecten yessoensis]|nr:carbohydrate sulfotransferase 4-like [Mizuhopecten yessoensis]
MTKCNKVTMSVLCLFVLASIGINKYFNPSVFVKKEFEKLSFQDTISEIPHVTPKVTKILVVAYMRSGSSFTAESLQHGPDVSFYSFEPLLNVVKGSIYAMDCKGSNCRVVNRTDELSQTTASIIKNIFECKMSALPDEALYAFSVFSQLRDHGRLKDCFPKPEEFKQITNNTRLSSMMERKSQCLSFLESRCRNSTVRVIKTIRMSLHLCKDLSKTIENMKILHLVRDPRASVYSRRNLGLDFSNSLVKILCNRMSHDIDEGQLIGSYFPGRFYSLRYECLARNPETVLKKLYSDMSLEYDSETEKWMQLYMKSQNRGQNGYQVFKSNSSSRSTNWRLRIPYIDTLNIDSLCKDVYTKIGARSFNSAMELENLGMSDMYVTPYTERYCK